MLEIINRKSETLGPLRLEGTLVSRGDRMKNVKKKGNKKKGKKINKKKHPSASHTLSPVGDENWCCRQEQLVNAFYPYPPA